MASHFLLYIHALVFKPPLRAKSGLFQFLILKLPWPGSGKIGPARHMISPRPIPADEYTARFLYTAGRFKTTWSTNMLNPNLDTNLLAGQYSTDDRLRIHDLLLPDFAARLSTACRDDVPYEYLYHVDGQNLAMPAAELSALNQKEQHDLQEKIISAASEGVGFFYCGYQMRRAPAKTDDPKLAFLHQMFDFVNSDEMLSFVRAITGQSDLKFADAHYTRYTSGQFLTRHKDDITREGRRIAYVLGLSEHWHPDWGGLLQFFGDDGSPRDFLIPAFNTLTLFDVRHVHSVSYVTPFAKEPRFSLAGWFGA